MNAKIFPAAPTFDVEYRFTWNDRTVIWTIGSDLYAKITLDDGKPAPSEIRQFASIMVQMDLDKIDFCKQGICTRMERVMS